MIVVYKIDRIFRSLKNLVTLIDHFNRHQIQFKSLTEPEFDTTSSNGRFLLQIFGAVAKFERNLISERTRIGFTNARKRKKCWADLNALKKKLLRSIITPNIFMKQKTSPLIKPVRCQESAKQLFTE